MEDFSLLWLESSGIGCLLDTACCFEHLGKLLLFASPFSIRFSIVSAIVYCNRMNPGLGYF